MAGGVAALLAVVALAWWMTRPERPPVPDPTPLDASGERTLGALRDRARALETKTAALRPGKTYVVIDTGRNLLTLFQNGKEILKAVCSTGSGRALADPVRRRKWVFDTPRGEFVIRKKYPNPVWVKPDWAFLEVGEPIPRSLDERLAPAELGAYAMDLGDGYLIHGTLYQRALGLSITHGCVRLGDDDLETVYEKVKVGTQVFIY
jgi:L,D-transpeptidase YbiS